MAGDKPKQFVYEIFSIKRRFYYCKFQPPKFKKGSACGRQRRVPPKNSYFTATGLCSVKTLADRCRHAAYHNEH